jgi:hypothetical protein
MDKNPYLIGLALAISASQAVALDEEAFKVVTTHDLVELCDTKAGERYHEFARGFCLGYLDAAWDYHEALTEGPKFDAIACPEAAVTRDDALQVFLAWAKANPGELDKETPVHGVMRAIADRWPCPAE